MYSWVVDRYGWNGAMDRDRRSGGSSQVRRLYVLQYAQSVSPGWRPVYKHGRRQFLAQGRDEPRLADPTEAIRPVAQPAHHAQRKTDADGFRPPLKGFYFRQSGSLTLNLLAGSYTRRRTILCQPLDIL